jgi:UDP-N-acetyl-D-glucosamine dehydrogenase
MLSIEQFLSHNLNKKVVVVQGLGFVGAVMSLVVANALTEEYAVIGVDLDNDTSRKKIEKINNGEFPIKADDPKIELFYQKARKKGNLYATSDISAYTYADVIIVDINLDVQKKNTSSNELVGYDVDLSPFKKAMQTIGENCKEDILVLVETTVPPGTCEHIVKPILLECFQKRGFKTDNLKIGHSYERVMPGPKYIDSIQNFYRVFSGVDEKSKRATETFLRTVISTEEYPLTELGNTNATEMAKVLENSYRAMNIGFMVEWTRFAEEAGVNIYEVVNAIRMRPTHKNLMLPGIGVGGYCLTKDPLLASWAKKNIFKSEVGLTQSETGVRTNDMMPFYAYQFLKKAYNKQLDGAKILLLGVSYLNDVGDTRYTPVEVFYNCLETDNTTIVLHDPYITEWEEKTLHVSNDWKNLLSEKYDIIVISTGHSLYRNNEELKNLLKQHNNGTMLYDTIGIFTREEIEEFKTFLNFQVLGRGDLLNI